MRRLLACAAVLALVLPLPATPSEAPERTPASGYHFAIYSQPGDNLTIRQLVDSLVGRAPLEAAAP